MAIKTGILLFLFFFATYLSCESQSRPPVTWTFDVDEVNASHMILTVEALIPEGWHLSSQYNNPGGSFPTRLRFTPHTSFRLIGSTTELGNCIASYDSIYETEIRSCSGKIEYAQRIQVLARPCRVEVTVEYLACSGDMCIPSRTSLTIPIN